MSKRIFVIIVIAAIGAVFIYYMKRPIKSTVSLDEISSISSIYYKVTDNRNQTSIVHDSGVDPKTSPIILRISKIEYNEGVKKELNTPTIIEYGTNPFNLNKVIANPHIEESDDLYILHI